MKAINQEIVDLYNVFKKHPVISTDSRKIPNGCIFIALKGPNFNGNQYAGTALEKGAVIALVDDPELKGADRMFYVNDTLQTLQDLASYHRKQLGALVIGLTGSNGKTTTKELIAAVLSRKYQTHSTAGNLNNHFGVPLTLLAMNEDTSFCIIEMGANHIGEISQLCNIADPDFGLITNIGKAHLEGFGGYEGVIRAKSELYQYIGSKSGKVFVNYDNPLLVQVGKGLEHISYGKATSNYCSGTLLSEFPHVGLQVLCKGNNFRVDSNLFGGYNFENILTAVCVGSYFDIEPADIADAIGSYCPDNLRSQLIKTNKNLLLMDAYNANPTSMKAAIENFTSGDYQNKMVILGEMLELGIATRDEHQTIVDLVVSKSDSIETAVFIGRNFSLVVPVPELFFETTDVFMDFLKRNEIKDKTILIKGSRGNQLERLIEML
jgi:UDP-N-acetylmuramoyl-tripeptide--D-alanyl-D-alanine ligase